MELQEIDDRLKTLAKEIEELEGKKKHIFLWKIFYENKKI